MTISYSFGIVDFLHFGHIRMFQDAKAAGDKHIFGLVEDNAIMQFHGNTVSSFGERMSVVSGISYIDEVWRQNSFDPLQNLKLIHKNYPDAKIILFVGSDRLFVPCEEFLKSIGGEIRVVEYYEKLSPRNIISALTAKTKRSKNYYSNLISTKANTLLALKDRLTKSKIEDIQIVTVGDFFKNKELVFESIYSQYQGKKIVCRSSSTAEDCFESSNAGHFDSVLNVDSGNKDDVFKALKQVAESYNTKAENYLDEQILIQTMTEDVICSGVIFTRDVNSNLPYYLINYDDGSSTDSVTSGAGGTTAWILRRTAKNNPPEKWRNLIAAVREIESILKKIVLDIEFAIKRDNSVVIFQVRPLAAIYKFDVKKNDEEFYELHEKETKLYNNIKNYRDSTPMLLSDMAFWNPSEIIGVNPHYLDYSLYREIITRRAWCEGLLPLGYTNVSDDLMFRIGNKPYISVDYSFLALTPNDLPAKTKVKLISYYREKLQKDTTAHDKIEFEIVFSCFDFSTNRQLHKLTEHGFTDDEINEIKTSLFNLTNDVISNYPNYIASDKTDLKELESERKHIQDEIEKRDYDYILALSSIYRLISLIKKYGTPQFSRHARCAFISRSLCKSMVQENLISEKEMDVFMSSINTVASEFEHDFSNYSNGTLSKADFNEKYGHLRSGTYDIQSARYDNTVFPINDTKARDKKASIVIPKEVIENMTKALCSLGFKSEPDQIIEFIKISLEQREYFKFIFTRSLSLAIELLAKVGSQLDITPKDLSFLDISDVYAAQYYGTMADLKEFWETIISKRKEIFEQKSQMILPAFVSSKKDLDMIVLSESRPNFISTGKISADVAVLSTDMNMDITNKIVVIEKADPGYDWIFTKGIVGLITKYGGAASHMAIRCAEFGLPAAIGCGGKIFNYVKASQKIEMDCNNKKIVRLF